MPCLLLIFKVLEIKNHNSQSLTKPTQLHLTQFSMYVLNIVYNTQKTGFCLETLPLNILPLCKQKSHRTCTEQDIHYLGTHDRFAKDGKLSGCITFLYNGSLR